MKISFKFGLSFLFILISSINSANSRFLVKAATIKELSSSQHNLPNPNLYSYEGRRGQTNCSLIIIRSLGDNSAEQKIKWSGEINN